MGRSAALEQAYVHDVYEICNEVVSPLRPRVTQFLTSLEPGSLVCDVGCGNGRYLTPTNSFIYSIGIDRCHRLSQAARSRGNEVALCDNLELPFRSESFDAVLSLAVVHHFATKDRRVEAIREIARVLRIGGRAIITVWALEQRNRRFESQDILIPWQLSSAASASDDDDDDDFLPPYSAYSEDSATNSSRSAGDGDSSSLSSSSPVESCCIFMRRAIQKLASGKKHSWFLDSINAKDNKLTTGWDVEDAKNLPIELRRLEDFDDLAEPPIFRLDPLAEVLPSPSPVEQPSTVGLCPPTRILKKQASLNEDLMPESRQRDRDGVRRRIQKQASLNESFLCRSLSKRLQLLGHGLGGALRSSTEGLERATKTSLGKIIKTMSSNGRHELTRSTGANLIHTSSEDADAPPAAVAQLLNDTSEQPPAKHTHESGSDSSKESSLQSDTSVESEDSFASVIFVPNAELKVDPSPPPIQSPAPKFDAFILPEATQSPVTSAPPQRPPLSPAATTKKPPMPFIYEETRQCAQEDDEKRRLIDRVLVKGKLDTKARMKAYFSSRTTSLDIYNPETDDLESDSTEPSSPDSVDSVVDLQLIIATTTFFERVN
uniref:Methyltransferase type 11 domain-containing protein n=1 Tax=Phlebotomus papatasi TaxID=29031 RepID=A0A1B0DCA9_PHLPP